MAFRPLSAFTEMFTARVVERQAVIPPMLLTIRPRITVETESKYRHSLRVAFEVALVTLEEPRAMRDLATAKDLLIFSSPEAFTADVDTSKPDQPTAVIDAVAEGVLDRTLVWSKAAMLAIMRTAEFAGLRITPEPVNNVYRLRTIAAKAMQERLDAMMDVGLIRRAEGGL